MYLLKAWALTLDELGVYVCVTSEVLRSCLAHLYNGDDTNRSFVKLSRGLSELVYMYHTYKMPSVSH